MATSMDYNIETLSDTQSKLLAILPIPAASLSILGSVGIIYMTYNNNNKSEIQKWTPYHRLLVAMSVCDIIFSITLAVSAFSFPKETSRRVWAMGNETTCSIVGFFMQFSNSTILYNAMLSFYFLLLSRFDVPNQKIAKRIEPIMHLLSVGYPLITAVVGSVMDVYSEPTLGPGCWVNDYPRGCEEAGETCLSTTIAWIFGGAINIFVFLALVINNFVIWIFVSRKVKQVKSHPIPTKEFSFSHNNEDDDFSSFQESNKNENPPPPPDTRNTPEATKDKPTTNGGDNLSMSQRSKQTHSFRTSGPLHQNAQSRRLRLVRSQAFLFVGGYFVCVIWTAALRLLEGYSGSIEEELKQPVTYYWLLVLQAWFLPLQGFFNMLIYMRPKYLRLRHANQKESRISALRGSLGIGKKHASVEIHNDIKDQEAQLEVNEGSKIGSNVEHNGEESQKKTSWLTFQRLSKGMISSITASQGDFVENIPENGRWYNTTDGSKRDQMRQVQRKSSKFESILEDENISSSPVEQGSKSISKSADTPMKIPTRAVSVVEIMDN